MRLDTPLRNTLAVLLLAAVALPAGAAEKLSVYCSTGDNQWVSDWQPVDSPATVDAMFEWLHDTWGVTRVYWRGEQERIWLQQGLFRPENPRYYEWWTTWIRHLIEDVNTDDCAVRAARKRGMEIYLHTSLFDYGAPGDAGGCGQFPYGTQDKLLLAHPEWQSVDRWGERAGSGTPEFCYPELRRALVDRHVKYAAPYDGISFYTYVENMSQRYMDEYGYNEPIVREFQRRYGKDIRREPFDKAAWNRLRGEYVTQFLAELHRALAAQGKKLSVVVRPDEAHLPQRWLCIPDETLPTGGIYMDWERWVRRGLVDELLIWVGGSGTYALAERMLTVCEGTGVKVVVMSSSPLAEVWQPLRDRGLTLCSVAAPGYGIDPWAREATSPETLQSPSWRLRVQTLVDVAAGKVPATPEAAARLTDRHVLVRREALRALAALKAAACAPAVEKALGDPESSVRIAAATALGAVHGPESAERLLAALEKDEGFQFVEATIVSLIALKDTAGPALQAHARSRRWWVRAAVLRAITGLGPATARPTLLAGLQDPDYRVRYWALGGVKAFADDEATTALLQALADPTPTVQLGAAVALGDKAGQLKAPFADQAFAGLVGLFAAYGDNCRRSDKDWGWRPVGMALLRFGERGKAELEKLRDQRFDQRLAWNAYLVLHVPQDPNAVIPCPEAEAVATHDKYAPPFPGHRR